MRKRTSRAVLNGWTLDTHDCHSSEMPPTNPFRRMSTPSHNPDYAMSGCGSNEDTTTDECNFTDDAPDNFPPTPLAPPPSPSFC
jgi:hypothetical protein